ncbi:MAG: DNA polymerase III subunit gamma/tau [Zoogloeaceae bacterium]|nr:DNA polymerase III subunit gamma/tau [Zoogloeaceae bacterium]
MAYQVLARKWRPRSFDTLVGQEHVVRALTHALTSGRLHHAYLFTGTRGVGKTTISRILAKSLNCVTGVTAKPCGECEACLAIDADRFPDYVEMDAASNRGVDDMASLLDKAVYAPVAGRYKVYMIDEVHMLTGHAFNAMLKTLEEPPAHVKFILATTDPQKIPVTVLSRCLQFNLKQMPPDRIVGHLTSLLEAEGVPFESQALRHIARGAEGSMRDALSLLDQAIAHGGGRVEESAVQDMLGAVGDEHLHALLAAVAAEDVAAMLAVADAMHARSLAFGPALQGLATLIHRAALFQFAPDAVTDEAERAALAPHAVAFDPEFLQLAYQIVVHGRDELPLAPDEYAGFTMTMLRLVAFRPEGSPGLGGGPSSSGPAKREARGRLAGGGERRVSPVQPPAGGSSAPAAAATTRDSLEPAPPVEVPTPAPVSAVGTDDSRAPPPVNSGPKQAEPLDGDWHTVLATLKLGGMVRQLAQNCEKLGFDDGLLRLRLADSQAHLLAMNRGTREKLQAELTARFGCPVRVAIEVGKVASETPAQREAVEHAARHQAAVAALAQDPFVQEIMERLDATLEEASVRSL